MARGSSNVRQTVYHTCANQARLRASLVLFYHAPVGPDAARRDRGAAGPPSRSSEASLHINERLDFDTVLQGVLDRAYSLTGVRYGVITIFDDTGQAEDSLAHGPTAEQAQRLWELPDSGTSVAGLVFMEAQPR